MPKRFWRKRPCLPLSMSERDLSGLLLGPVTGRPRRPLSISASTDSCSMRFSLRIIISGAPSSKRRLSLLFLFITRLYRSLRSEVANLPPSSCTIGRKSGGMTGMQSSIIHSGLLPESLKASTTSSLFKMRTRFWPVAVLSSSLSSCEVSSRSISSRSFFMVSAPMPASKSSSYFSRMSRYSFSFSICFFCSSRTLPGSVTI